MTDDRVAGVLVVEEWEKRWLIDDTIAVVTVGPDRTLTVVRGGAMSWDAARELRNFLVNDGGCRVWIEGFLHPVKGWSYRIVMRSPYADADDRCGGV